MAAGKVLDAGGILADDYGRKGTGQGAVAEESGVKHRRQTHGADMLEV